MTHSATATDGATAPPSPDPSITLCFYRGRLWPPASALWYPFALLTRWGTQRPAQPLRDVPCHVALLIADPEGGPVLIESEAGGVLERAPGPDDLAWTVRVPVTPEQGRTALAWARARVGTPYRTWDVALIALRWVLTRCGCPSDVRIVDRSRASWICSTLALGALRAAGLPVGAWLRASGNDFSSPASPNDAYLAACHVARRLCGGREARTLA